MFIMANPKVPRHDPAGDDQPRNARMRASAATGVSRASGTGSFVYRTDGRGRAADQHLV
ncbi:MAG: hypothetical protein KIT14_16050 [bacterium]|nr:hypothetical protein [bacterium]